MNQPAAPVLTMPRLIAWQVFRINRRLFATLNDLSKKLRKGPQEWLVRFCSWIDCSELPADRFEKNRPTFEAGISA
jgi:hypothetical protein